MGSCGFRVGTVTVSKRNMVPGHSLLVSLKILMKIFSYWWTPGLVPNKKRNLKNSETGRFFSILLIAARGDLWFCFGMPFQPKI